MDILSSRDAYYHLKNLISVDVEEFWAVALTTGKILIKSQMLFRGTVDSCLVHPREVFRFACLNGASSLIVAHNHPLGETIPSFQDLSLTKRLLRASRTMDIPILDHLILNQQSYRSLADEGWLHF